MLVGAWSVVGWSVGARSMFVWSAPAGATLTRASAWLSMVCSMARAEIHGLDGSVQDVTGKVEGLVDYHKGWEQSPDFPQAQRLVIGQGGKPDDPTAGRRAYRFAYKTLRVAFLPSLTVDGDRLRIRLSNGDIERGGYTVPKAVATRHADEVMVPETARLVEIDPGKWQLLRCPDMQVAVEAYEDTVKAVSFVEVFWFPDLTFEGSWEELRDLGRRRTALIKTVLDFTLGPRALSVPLLEEVGRLDADRDWHWSRRIDGPAILLESQANFQHVDGTTTNEKISASLDFVTKGDEASIRRLRLACQWYWRADAESDPVIAFSCWWFIIEALEMPTPDVIAVKRRVADLLGEEDPACSEAIGRLYGLRSKLVHGEEEAAEVEALRRVRRLACALLRARLIPTSIADVVTELHAVLRPPSGR